MPSDPGVSERRRLAAVRRHYANRQGAPSLQDRWFVIYVCVLLIAIYIAPTVYLLGQSMNADSARALTTPGSAAVLSCWLTAAFALMIPAGRVQGPAFLAPFPGHVLLTGALDRRRVLAKPLISRILALSCLVVALAAVVVAALGQTGIWAPIELLGLLTGAGLYGILLGMAWFLGQRLPAPWVAGLSVASVLLAAMALAGPAASWAAPGGWLARLWAGDPLGLAALVLACLIGGGLLAGLPYALRGMPVQHVLNQSRRLSEARLYTSSGNINDALELFRTLPRHGRRTQAVLGRRLLWAGLRRDAVAAVRTPGRLLASGALLAAGSALVAYAVGILGQSGSLVTASAIMLSGMALVFAGTGAIADGWRQLKDEYDAAPLFGWGRRTAVLRRIPWPLLVWAATLGLGLVLNLGLQNTGLVPLPGGSPSDPGIAGEAVFLGHAVSSTGIGWVSSGWTAGLTLIGFCARFMTTMRPAQLPLERLNPILTPFGDLSGLQVLFWIADGLLLCLTAALAMVLLPWSWWGVALALTALGASALVVGWDRLNRR